MIDHRRTPSQRAYQLPGWFFVLTAVLSVFALAAVGWVFLADPFDPLRGASQDTASPSPSASTAEAGPSPTAARATSGAPAGGQSDNDGERSSIDVVVLNASGKPGLAADVADAAEKAGWTVAEVGNWIYPAAVNAVYYPEGHQTEAELLAKDVEIESVRPTRSGMSTDDLTVLLVYSP
jgi:hypothetical protein